ncbi:uncharacterized protein L969DRAFT_58344 [Mixia osmundae IAM 14324]|uniref:Uncharacterized protein n=1 Tax=Mixia osmundae (strain CBS 9802 / IAM 14324 / JCM 22182 / KY 12970) TaxID=764103 RepID=G7DXZ2_MIXOS|nr:uncharacterized protein L969DRAFT_58344 [Mixia osmundae IAM 14324]KEI41353.1 hypothetical protein L969DRAFT_58344 [Mixia osmundae IAM 14324]GAA95452.1 hypothetical protein E5Q_02106 [Mixia osmundae IAM 14324]
MTGSTLQTVGQRTRSLLSTGLDSSNGVFRTTKLANACSEANGALHRRRRYYAVCHRRPANKHAQIAYICE